MTALQGLGVSGGVVIGPVALAAPAEPLPEEVPAADPGADVERIRAALETVAADLDARAAALTGDAADMVSAAATLARDPGLLGSAEQQVRSGQGPAHALAAAVEEYAEQLSGLGDYFAERVTDLRDVGARAIAVILDRPAPGVPELTEPSIVVAHDLAPADTALMDPALVLGLVTEAGGRTSHTAILAAQRGIPAVVRASGALDLAPGTMVGIDGDTGAVTIDPGEEYLEAARAKAAARERANEVSGPGRTADGAPIALLANIGNVADAEIAGASDAEGSGLFRTEFLHLSSATAPTVAEQQEQYAAVFAPFGDRPITVRTLDAGADKPLAFADMGTEPNPALGQRGLRLMMAREDLLTDQLTALSQAQAATGAQVKVMAPMVATLQEATWFAERARAAGVSSAGVMIEVPAAALRAEQLFEAVDFVSLGTNDLAQYTMAADRMLGELSDLLDPWQPAVLDLIKLTCAAGQGARKPVGVCGESAGDPLMALVLAGLGATSLSMAPSRIPLVRYALSLHTMDQCRHFAELALAQESAGAAHAAVKAEVSAELVALL